VYKVFFTRLQRGVRYSAKLAYLNINLRLLTLLAIAEARGYTTPGDARALYSRQRRGRKADRLLRSATATHYLKQENHPQLGQIYIPTPKATEALHTARTLLNTGGHPTTPTHTNTHQPKANPSAQPIHQPPQTRGPPINHRKTTQPRRKASPQPPEQPAIEGDREKKRERKKREAKNKPAKPNQRLREERQEVGVTLFMRSR
jgi:hypothetical protein